MSTFSRSQIAKSQRISPMTLINKSPEIILALSKLLGDFTIKLICDKSLLNLLHKHSNFFFAFWKYRVLSQSISQYRCSWKPLISCLLLSLNLAAKFYSLFLKVKHFTLYNLQCRISALKWCSNNVILYFINLLSLYKNCNFFVRVFI